MFIHYCQIGQLGRCKTGGCEWSKTFSQHCPSAPEYRPVEVRIDYSKKKKKAKLKFELVNEENNLFKTPKQDDWIKKIKVIK